MNFLLILVGISMYILIDSITTPKPNNEFKPQLKDGENIIIPDEVKNTSNEFLENKKHVKKAGKTNKSKSLVEKNNNPIRSNNKLDIVADYDDFYSSIRKNYKIQKYKENKIFLRKSKKMRLLDNQDDDNNGDGPIRKL